MLGARVELNTRVKRSSGVRHGLNVNRWCLSGWARRRRELRASRPGPMPAVCMLGPAGLGATGFAGLSVGFAERSEGGGGLHATPKSGCISCIIRLHKVHNSVA